MWIFLLTANVSGEVLSSGVSSDLFLFPRRALLCGEVCVPTVAVRFCSQSSIEVVADAGADPPTPAGAAVSTDIDDADVDGIAALLAPVDSLLVYLLTDDVAVLVEGAAADVVDAAAGGAARG